ncbi:hypothetical protein PVL29_004617 [Vitis rotundifolia]|uniref:Uncharacterized protein n=1 Tax=Vitis rotundifolia TaxID=103349 RepID=A0AA39AAR6_VITRO|nr:hypothetical protein PVL29_004617 [Vitis rotundifolia]
MNVNLPFESQSTAWKCLFHHHPNRKFVVSQFSTVPQGILDIIQTMVHAAHLMGVFVNVMSVLSIFHPNAHSILAGSLSVKIVWFPQSVLVFLSSFINFESPYLPSFDSPDEYHSQTIVCRGEPKNNFESTTRVDHMVSIRIDTD